MVRLIGTVALSTALLVVGCKATDVVTPERTPAASFDAAPWGPETPHFNIEVILRGPDGGYGHVKFRQPNDDLLLIHLDTWVRDLKPNTSYLLQRAVDTDVNDICTSGMWLTLGRGLTPQAILTDERGTGRAALFRVLSTPLGTTFDIYFRVIEATTGEVALTSDCYQFTVSQ